MSASEALSTVKLIRAVRPRLSLQVRAWRAASLLGTLLLVSWSSRADDVIVVDLNAGSAQQETATTSAADAVTQIAIAPSMLHADTLSVSSIDAPPTPEPITWTYEEIYNPVENTKNYLAQVRIADIGIVLRCSAVDRRAQIRINLPKAVLDEMDHVSWAFDNRTSQSARWPINISGRSMRVPADVSRGFARNLQAFNALHLDVVDAQDRAAAYTVPLRKSSQAINSLDELCFF